MGKNKNRFNWKARQGSGIRVHDAKEVDKVAKSEGKGFDESNAFVLPSKKDLKLKRLKHKDEEPVGRILSKRRRKHLEKIVEKKAKKEQRSELLSKLESVQVSDQELERMTSLAHIQTKGLKRQFAEDEWKEKMDDMGQHYEVVRSSDPEEQTLQKPKKVKLKSVMKKPEIIQGENVLGFESSSESDDLESEPEVEPEVQQEPVAPTLKKEEPMTEVKPNTSTEPERSNEALNRVAKFVPVMRSEEVQKLRNKLPIISEEQAIMEAINDNPVTILVGETGSGKTTQVPQFLYEGGFAESKLIGVTEPRRVAAMAMAGRVGHEMSLGSDVVSYQIRFEGNVTGQTKIKFMTDGVLLREIERDFMLTKYSVIIIDEAHERSVFTDILIGFLSRIVPKREADGDPLKLVIMSATLRVEDFTQNQRLFKVSPPVIKVESRQFDVQCHFNRKTNEDYVEEAFRKVSKIHKTLPEGGILVFLTGQAEVKAMVRRLQRLFPSSKQDDVDKDGDETIEEGLKKALKKRRKRKVSDGEKFDNLPNINLDNYEILPHDDTEADAMREAEKDDDLADDEDLDVAESGPGGQPMWTLPLYSLLSSERQNRIFKPVPDGHRLCVVATNVAETSLTIPGIKYVVDCGKVKNKLYDKVTGVSTFQVMWASKAQSNQRAGRAGRQGPGHCYRLYSSAVFENDFQNHALPEIQTRPLEDLVLQMKAMYLDNVVNFPFPTPPDVAHVRAAEKKLITLGALAPPPKNLPLREIEKAIRKAKITKLGRAISTFPLSPRFGKMLALSHQHDLMQYTITMVAALSLQEVLLEMPVGDHQDQFNKAELQQIRREWAGKGQSLQLGDPLVLIRAVAAAEFAGISQEFCERNGLRYKAMVEIRKLRRQLSNEINVILPSLNLVLNPELAPPSSDDCRLLRQIVLAGTPDQIAHKIDVQDMDPKERSKMRFAYHCSDIEEPVFLKSTSVLKQNPPEWIAYQEIYEIEGKMYMRCATAIEPQWLPMFCEHLCQLSSPLPEPQPWMEDGNVMCHVNGTFGKRSWVLPTVPIVYPKTPEKFKYFAKLLLEGKVLEGLDQYTEQLLSPPVVMIKSWGSLHGKRTTALYDELVARDVDSVSRLKQVLSQEPAYLRSAYLRWIPESLQHEVKNRWAKITTF